MSRFSTVRSRVVPLLIDNIDTDQIIPARFLKSTGKVGLGVSLFADWRYGPDGTPNAAFVLNDPAYAGASILLAGDNFGCGSSREHAPWALTSHGFRVVLSTSFADIFRNNSLKNGLLPVVLAPQDHKELQEEFKMSPYAEVLIDLESQRVTFPGGKTSEFPIDPFSKLCLLNGIDELEYLRRFMNEIEAYEEGQHL
jgi:3-isopropylmalate/(R)-2-methylmalate dehydratase small subunit